MSTPCAHSVSKHSFTRRHCTLRSRMQALPHRNVTSVWCTVCAHQSRSTNSSLQVARISKDRSCVADTNVLPRVVLATLLSSAAAVCLFTASPAVAQVEGVTAQQALSLARPFPKQAFDKNKVWLLFVGASSLLFLGTVLLENNSSLFPAISRANQAMQDMKQEQERERLAQEALMRERAAIDTEVAEVQRQSRLVEESLAEARARVLGGNNTTPTPPSEPLSSNPPDAPAQSRGPLSDQSSSISESITSESSMNESSSVSISVSEEGFGPGAVGVRNGSGGLSRSQGVKSSVEAAEVIRGAASSYVLEAKQALAALKQQAAAVGVPEVGNSEASENEKSKV